MRTVAAATRQILEASRHAFGLVYLVRITHPDLDTEVCLVTDETDWFFDGKTWTATWFELTLLSDNDRPPKTTFKFPNVDYQKTRLLETVKGPARVFFDVYSTDIVDHSADPRTVLPGLQPEHSYSAKYLDLTDAEITPAFVTGTLKNLDPRRESWPPTRAHEGLAEGASYQ